MTKVIEKYNTKNEWKSEGIMRNDLTTKCYISQFVSYPPKGLTGHSNTTYFIVHHLVIVSSNDCDGKDGVGFIW